MTTWKPIPGHPDYELSEEGQLRSWRKFGSGKGRADKPRLLIPHKAPDGYYKVTVATISRTHSINLHALMALTFHGERPEGAVVRHLDGNKENNSAANLAYGTPRENNLDTLRGGRNHEANKTHCPHGHPYDAENTMLQRRTRRGRTFYTRVCRECTRIRNAARKSRARKAVA